MTGEVSTAIAGMAAAVGGGAIVTTKTLAGDPTASGESDSTQTAGVGGTWVGRTPDGWTAFRMSVQKMSLDLYGHQKALPARWLK